MGGPFNFWVPKASRPHPLFPLHRSLLLSLWFEDTPWVPRGGRGSAHPCPKRPDGSGTSAPGFPSPGAPSSPFSSGCLLGALPLSRCGGCWGSLLLPRLFTWAPMPPSIVCERLNGRFVHGSLGGGLLAHSGLGGARPRGGGGQDSFLYPRVPFLSPERSLEAACFFFGPFWMLGPFWAEPVWRGRASRLGGTRDAGWLSLGGAKPGLPWIKARAWPLPKWERGYPQCNRGSFSPLGPDPFFPGLGGFPGDG
ncbi:hypothetical protein GWK47_046510 [Chionoecetes opilio]|uniref:Uncharacterized protein n=1 Tax=Chionoecetes opilio TaxID=41210 RepID=A0A8J4Y668_CHIOP|nr:hypothetical protein GWK47_046510 [Chionoecetes opilio]